MDTSQGKPLLRYPTLLWGRPYEKMMKTPPGLSTLYISPTYLETASKGWEEQRRVSRRALSRIRSKQASGRQSRSVASNVVSTERGRERE